jgi:hypothetical protein
MLASLLLGFLISGGSLVAMGGRLDSAALAARPLGLPNLLVACLDPAAVALEIAAIVLIILDSRQSTGVHRLLALLAGVFFALWAIANLGGFLPPSFMGMQRGSLALVKAGQWVKMLAALLQYSVPFLLVFGLSHGLSRALLWLALILTVAGNLGTVALTISGIQLELVEYSGQTLYAPRFQADYRTGIRMVLLALGYLGGILYIGVYAILTWHTWRMVRIDSEAGA